MLKPSEQRHCPLIIIQGLIILALVILLVSTFPELIVCHKTGTALQTPSLLVVLPLEEERVLEIDRVVVKKLSGDGSGDSFLEAGEVDFVGREVVLEFGNKRLVVSLLIEV